MQEDGIWGIPLDISITDLIEKKLSTRFLRIQENASDGKIYIMRTTRKQLDTRKTQIEPDGKSRVVEYIVKEIDDNPDIQEGEICLKFFHCAHIVKFYDQIVSLPKKKRYLILECINGGSVINQLFSQQLQCFEHEQVRTVGLNILQALNCLHSEKVYHRDVKPDNICFDQTNKCYKLIDFSRSKLGDEGSYKVGTDLYESPEVRARLNSLDYAASDLFSLGLTLVRLLFGLNEVQRVSQELDKLVKTQGWQHKKEVFTVILDLSRIVGSDESSYLGTLMAELLELNPTKRPTALTLLQKHGGEICPQDHRTLLTKPRPPHLLLPGVSSHSKHLETLLRGFIAAQPLTARVSGECRLFGSTNIDTSALPNNTNHDMEDKLFTLEPRERKKSDITQQSLPTRESDQNVLWTKVRLFLDKYPEQLGALLEDMPKLDVKPSNDPVLVEPLPQEHELTDMSAYHVPGIRKCEEQTKNLIQVEPPTGSPTGFFIGDSELTGIGIIPVPYLEAIYLGGFCKGIPNYYGMLFQSQSLNAHPKQRPATDLVSQYLEYVFSDTDSMDTVDFTFTDPWHRLFRFQFQEQSQLSMFAGRIENGRPARLSANLIEYSNGISLKTLVSGWELSSKCSVFFDTESAVRGFFSRGRLDKHAPFLFCCYQKIHMRQSKHRKKTSFQKTSTESQITLHTEDGWRFRSPSWRSYHSANGTIELLSHPGLEFEYKGNWNEFLLNDDTGNAELKIALKYKTHSHDRLSIWSQRSSTGEFEKHWISIHHSDSRQITVSSQLDQVSVPSTANDKLLSVLYKGCFKDNTFQGFGHIKIEAKWLNILAEYEGGFQDGWFHDDSKESTLKLDVKGKKLINIVGKFKEGELHGKTTITISKNESTKPLIKMEATFGKGCLLQDRFWLKFGESFSYESFTGKLISDPSSFRNSNKCILFGELVYRSGSTYEGYLEILVEKDQQNQEMYPSDSLLRNQLFSQLDNLKWSSLASYFRMFGEYKLVRCRTGTLNVCSADSLIYKCQRYDGEWQNDQTRGRCRIHISQHEEYEGNVNHGAKFDGEGVYMRKGKTFRGVFVNGKLPIGVCSYDKDGCMHEYIGEFNPDFKEHGQGELKTLFASGKVICKEGVVTWANLKFSHMGGILAYQGSMQAMKFHDMTGSATLSTSLYKFTGKFEEDNIKETGQLIVFDGARPEIQIYKGPISPERQTKGKNASISFFDGNEFAGEVYAFASHSELEEETASKEMDVDTSVFPAGDPLKGVDIRFRVYYPKRWQLHGRGKYTCLESGRVFQCYLVRGYPEGIGSCTGMIAGRPYKYEGEFRKGKLHGKGQMFFTDNSDYIYSENWTQDTVEKGVAFYQASKQRYVGGLLQLMRHGRGVVEFPPTDPKGFQKFEGEFKCGKMQGLGVMKFANGNIFEGMFDNGSQRGPGIMTTKSYILKGQDFKSFWLAGHGYFYKFRQGSTTVGDLYVGTLKEGTLEKATVYIKCKQYDPGNPTDNGAIGYEAIYKGKVVPSTYKLTDESAEVIYVHLKMMYEGSMDDFKWKGKGKLTFLAGHVLSECSIHGEFKDDYVRGNCLLKYSNQSKQDYYVGAVDEKFLPKGKGEIYFREAKRKWIGDFEKGIPKGKGDFYEHDQKKGKVDGSEILKQMTVFW